MKDLMGVIDPMGSKMMQNKRSSRKLTLEDPKDILTVIHKMELFTPPPAIDGNDFSGNLLELMDAQDPSETVACFVKMERNVERVEFHSVDDKKAWIADVQKAAKSCFETWKKDYFKSMVEARMSQRSVTAPQPSITSLPIPTNSSVASNHARSSSLGDVRVNPAVAALEKNNGPVDKVVRKSPRGSHHPPVPLAWLTGRVSPLSNYGTEGAPEHPPSPKSILKSNSSSNVSFSTPEPHPTYISTQNRQLASFKTCPDIFNPLPRNTSEQNWEVESDELGLRESRGSSSMGDESGRDSALMNSAGSIGSSTEVSQPISITRSSEHPRVRRMTVGSPGDVEFWDEVRRGNEAAKDLEKELERVGVTPRGGSLVRSQRKNFAVALTTEDTKSLNGKAPASSLNTVDELMSLHKHELAKKDEELAKKREELAKKDEELKKKDEEIAKLKSQVTDEAMRTRIFRDKFQDMQKLYHEADMRDKAKPQDAADHLRLNEELSDLKKKLTDERDSRRFYRDKFQDMQRLYQECLTSIIEFQEQVKKLGTSDKDGDAKWEQRVEEERLRKQFFKDKFQEMNRLYQESLESVTTFVEKSREAEKMYRATLEEANNSKRRTQELEGLYFETQESVEFFREKVQAVEEACRESMREAEYFRLKAEKMEKALFDAQKSVSLYQSNMDAMSNMLREAQNECIFYKQKSHEQEMRKSKEVQALHSHDNGANGDAHASEMAELQQLYREAQASAQRYRELAEERVKRLEATVEKYKNSTPASPPTAVQPQRSPSVHHAAPKLTRTKSQINTARMKDRRKTQRPGLRRSRGESIVIKESDADSEQSTQESEALPHTEEDENYEQVRVSYQSASSPQLQISSPEPLSSSSSQASPNITLSPILSPSEGSASGGEDEFEMIERGNESSDHGSAHKPHRGSGSKLRAQKLQKQIHQRLMQKSLKQSS